MAAISNVDIGDSVTNRTASNFGQNVAITITSAVVGVTYRDFLSQSESRPFKVGKTMIISSSARQLDNPVSITHRNAVGDRRDFTLGQSIDPYQTMEDRVVDNTEYMFDGYTRIRFSTINNNATVTIRIFPKNIFSATSLVAGRPSQTEFSAPSIGADFAFKGYVDPDAPFPAKPMPQAQPYILQIVNAAAIP